MWFIPSRNRPELMKDLIESIRKTGDIPDAAVMLDGDLYDIEWPDNWVIHQSSEHLELQRALNKLLELHPNEKTYGFITDHARPISENWSKIMEDEAGDWNISLCNDIRNRVNNKNGLLRITSASCFGGELVRAMGFIWPTFCVHLAGDDALEEIGHELGLIKHLDVLVKDLHFYHGEIPIDNNHQRMYQGEPYTHSDLLAFYAWRRNGKQDLLRKLENIIPFEARGKSPEKITICCLQVGDYCNRGFEYVNTLHDMVLRNMPDGLQFEFICFTDDVGGLNQSIDARPLPNPNLKGWWNKLALFKEGVFNKGEQIFYFDLDTLVLSDLEEIFSYRGDFCLLRDFYRNQGYGSGLMSWNPENNYDIWESFEKSGYLEVFGGDQGFIEQVRDNADIWQDLYPDKVVSYKKDCLPYPSKQASIVCFHGTPRPHECTQQWVKDVWKIGGASTLSLTVLQNTDLTQIFKNVKNNAKRATWLAECPPNEGHAIIAGSGCSLRDTVDIIQAGLAHGATLFGLNNAPSVLAEYGIKPHFHVILDARESNVSFVTDDLSHVYLIASQCSPKMFDACEGRQVIQWHPFIEGIEDLFPNDPMTLVGGGTTVGLSAMALAYAMGYRKISLFGYDSSYRDGDSHALPQERTEQESRTFEVNAGDKKFTTNAAMAKQAEIFPLFATNLANEGVEIRVFGDGLLPYLAQNISTT